MSQGKPPGKLVDLTGFVQLRDLARRLGEDIRKLTPEKREELMELFRRELSRPADESE